MQEDPAFHQQLATEMEAGFLPPAPEPLMAKVRARLGEHFSELAWKNADWVDDKETTLELAEVVRGEKASGRFVFTNIGDAPLKILAVKPACGCTTVDADWEQTVPPGGEGSFGVKLDTSRAAGQLTKTLSLTFPLGHPRLRELEIPVYVKVADPVEVNPDRIILPKEPAPVALKRLITAYCHDQFQDFAVGSVEVIGRDAGTVWTAPREIDLSEFVVEGRNSLQIRVANTWNNRRVADAQLPREKRLSHVPQAYRFKPDDPLHQGGLLGPVRVKREN